MKHNEYEERYHDTSSDEDDYGYKYIEGENDKKDKMIKRMLSNLDNDMLMKVLSYSEVMLKRRTISDEVSKKIERWPLKTIHVKIKTDELNNGFQGKDIPPWVFNRKKVEIETQKEIETVDLNPLNGEVDTVEILSRTIRMVKIPKNLRSLTITKKQKVNLFPRFKTLSNLMELRLFGLVDGPTLVTERFAINFKPDTFECRQLKILKVPISISIVDGRKLQNVRILTAGELRAEKPTYFDKMVKFKIERCVKKELGMRFGEDLERFHYNNKKDRLGKGQTMFHPDSRLVYYFGPNIVDFKKNPQVFDHVDKFYTSSAEVEDGFFGNLKSLKILSLEGMSEKFELFRDRVESLKEK